MDIQINKVFYLCNSGRGLVFLNEMPDDYYSMGTWFVEGNDKKYTFKIEVKDTDLELELTQGSNGTYTLEYSDTQYVFKLSNKKQKYVGSNAELKNKKLSQLIAQDLKLLDKAFLDSRIIFSGQSNV